MKQGLTEIIAIIDRSGSMDTLAHDMSAGFSRFLADQRRLPGDCRLTLVQFDSVSVDTVYENQPIVTAGEYRLEPRGGTPLLDALGDTITAVGRRYARTPEAQRPEHVIVMIITDGEENQSRRYSKKQVLDMVQHQQTVYKWQFLYLGANVDAFAEAGGVGIASAYAGSYQPTAGGVRNLYAVSSSAVARGRAGGSVSFTMEERETLKGS